MAELDMNIITDLDNPVDDVPSSGQTAVKVKVPRRILHFSDGILEEYSDDETDATEQKANQDQRIDVKRLEWGPWMIHRVLQTGNHVLSACDYIGEKIASFLGITTPKYSSEMEHFKRIQEERAKEREEERSVGGWMQEANDSIKSSESRSASAQSVTSQQPLQKY